MATTQYIGARYVPILADPVEWSNAKTYEPLTIVTHEGNSYTSRQFVPIGISIANGAYWVLTGNYNAQIEQYRRETAQAVDNCREYTDRAVEQVDEWLTDAQSKYGAKPFAFETVAGMQTAYELLYIGAICRTNGFHASGDGGAAWYVISDTGTANGMDVLACGNMFAHLVIDGSYVCPEMFGAYGDGITNDYASIRACADAAWYNKKELKLIAKKYYIEGDNPIGVPYGFTESGGRKTYNMNIDGGMSAISWKPSGDLDRFINGQHLRYSIVKNLHVTVAVDTFKGCFVSTKTSDGRSHTFSSNLFENCSCINFLYGFYFNATDANPTHDDLTKFINVNISCLHYYYTNNGNAVSHAFIGCSWNALFNDSLSNEGEFVNLDVNNWAGSLNIYGCHFTTGNNANIIKSIVRNRRNVTMIGCRCEFRGKNNTLFYGSGLNVKIDSFDTLVFDYEDYPCIVAQNVADVEISNSSLPSHTVKIQEYAHVSIANCVGYINTTFAQSQAYFKLSDDSIKKYNNLTVTTLPQMLSQNYVSGTFINYNLIPNILELRSMSPSNTLVVNRSTNYICPVDTKATFKYVTPNTPSSHAQFEVIVNEVSQYRGAISNESTPIIINAGDMLRFKFYQTEEATTDVAEGGIGVTAACMQMNCIGME